MASTTITLPQMHIEYTVLPSSSDVTQLRNSFSKLGATPRAKLPNTATLSVGLYPERGTCQHLLRKTDESFMLPPQQITLQAEESADELTTSETGKACFWQPQLGRVFPEVTVIDNNACKVTSAGAAPTPAQRNSSRCHTPPRRI